MGEPPDTSANLRWKSFAKTGREDLHSESSEVHSLGSIFIDPNVEPDKVVLRPQNRNHLLLSPREQDLPRDLNKKSAPAQLENNSWSM